MAKNDQKNCEISFFFFRKKILKQLLRLRLHLHLRPSVEHVLIQSVPNTLVCKDPNKDRIHYLHLIVFVLLLWINIHFFLPIQMQDARYSGIVVDYCLCGILSQWCKVFDVTYYGVFGAFADTGHQSHHSPPPPLNIFLLLHL